MDDLLQLVPAVGTAITVVGGGLAYICRRVDNYMVQKAAEERGERQAFRDFLIGREERSMRQLDAALEAQVDIRDAIREHTAAITRLTGQGETQTRRLEELNVNVVREFEGLRVLLQERR